MGYCQPFIFCRRTSVTVIRRTIKSVPAQKTHSSLAPMPIRLLAHPSQTPSSRFPLFRCLWNLHGPSWSVRGPWDAIHFLKICMYCVWSILPPNIDTQHPRPLKKAFICHQKISNSSLRFQDMAFRARILHFSQSLDHSPNLNTWMPSYSDTYLLNTEFKSKALMNAIVMCNTTF